MLLEALYTLPGRLKDAEDAPRRAVPNPESIGPIARIARA
jgi:hypothetical protein